MTDLAALERAFAAALVERFADDADVSALAGPAARARARLRLYRGNVQANARKALANAYPVCAALVGDGFFDGLADAYASGTPSRSGDLNEYGDAFAGFLAAFGPVTAQVPYLPDVAALEWRVHGAHYAGDAPAFDAAVLSALSDARLARVRLVAGPAAALIESAWPVVDVWRAHRVPGEPLDDVDLASGGQRALVFRPQFRVDVAAIGAGEHAFLAAVFEVATFEEALTRARAVDPAFALEPALQRWVADRVIVGAILPRD